MRVRYAAEMRFVSGSEPPEFRSSLVSLKFIPSSLALLRTSPLVLQRNAAASPRVSPIFAHCRRSAIAMALHAFPVFTSLILQTSSCKHPQGAPAGP
jgi:hypothetical protein